MRYYVVRDSETWEPLELLIAAGESEAGALMRQWFGNQKVELQDVTHLEFIPRAKLLVEIISN